MDRARIHEGIRRMRFTDVLGRSERSELSQMEAAELLGVSERTFTVSACTVKLNADPTVAQRRRASRSQGESRALRATTSSTIVDGADAADERVTHGLR